MTMLSIIIPAYNEEDGIRQISERVLAIKNELRAVGVENLELIIVDDGSRDRTREIIAEIPGVTLVPHPVNQGYGAALKTGFSRAKGELIGFLDADGTYPPEYFPQLCERALNGDELVIGSRMKGAASEMPIARRIGNVFFAGLLTLIARHRVTDSASGMRVFQREILERLAPLPDGLNLTPVMSTRAIHEGVSIAEVAIPYSERVGRSKLGVVRDGSLFLRSMIWTALGYNPVRLLGFIGLGGLAMAGVVSAGLIVARLRGITEIGPWGVAALFAAVVSAVLGMSLFALGATFNYLIQLFSVRPIQQGLFGKPLFTPSLDRHFGWMGLAVLLLGLVVGITALVLGIGGWEIDRLWLYLLGSAMMILLGSNLMIYWVLMRILEEINQRGRLVGAG
jgi:glycosyltransferase involved in cell wall biosynthesis